MEARQVVNVWSSLAGSQDLVMEVLSRLPTKSLFRFMRVSQEWYALIKSSRFIAIHLNHLQRLNPNLCLLYGRTRTCTSGDYTKYDKSHKFSILGKQDTQLVGLDLPEPVLRYDSNAYRMFIHIVGSSNGLVCLHLLYTSRSTMYTLKEKIVVWNPATRTHRYLPRPLSFMVRKERLPLLGFGFINVDNNAAEYKVVRISRSIGRDGKLTYLTQVYTRSENSWREVKNCVPPGNYYFESDFSVSLNGVLYCLAGTGSDRYVFSFNLHDEVVHNMPMPPRYSYVPDEQLFTWENSAGFLTHDEGKYNLWVMTKAFGTQMPTWKRTVQFAIKNPGGDLYLFVKRHVKAGQVRVTYDRATTKAIDKAFKRATGSSYHQVVDYMPSLASVV